jgi:RNA polymerase sigma-70 factor (ECF subfamily)
MEAFVDDGRHLTPIRAWGMRPEQEAMDKETQQLVEDAIATLPDSFRDVYLLADVEGLPNSEIADMLELSVPAVKSRLHRARLLMRSALAHHFEEASA